MTELNDFHAKGSRRGLKPGLIRYSIVIKDEELEKFRALAYWQRGTTLKEHFVNAVESYLEKQDSDMMKIAVVSYRKFLREKNVDK